MIGLITYLGSSPRRILAVLVVSAAAVAVAQFSPLLQVGPQGATGQEQTPPGVDNERIARIFDPRPIPERPAVTDVLPGNSPVSGQPGDPPAEVEDAVAEIPVSIPAMTVEGTETTESLVLRPTSAWINVFSDSSTLNGRPVQPGDIITAFDPDGTLVGRSVVTTEGQYGLMALYMDDPLTHVDEGAEPGDVIKFRVNGIEAVVMGPHAPVWTSNGAVLSLNLAAIG